MAGQQQLFRRFVVGVGEFAYLRFVKSTQTRRK